MKKVSAIFILTVLFALPALAQAPTCSEPRAAGIARSELGQCIAAATGPDFFVEVDALCECPEFGITVSAIGRLRCNPNEECPPFGFLIGSVTLDCNYNVIQTVCF
ncbi:MAG TPA: hypothetical protein VFR31_06815 [Thermoanaerobaculia bacterium]|nr:hypothetical protein [Thermoanaerobaculia bacterium]